MMPDATAVNWVAESTNTTGSGVITLLGALDGFAPFSVSGDGFYYYTIQDGANKECGTGTLEGRVFHRDNVHASFINGVYSVPGSCIELSGYAEIYCTINAQAFNYLYEQVARLGGIESKADQAINDSAFAVKTADDTNGLISGINIKVDGIKTDVDNANHNSNNALAIAQGIDAKATDAQNVANAANNTANSADSKVDAATDNFNNLWSAVLKKEGDTVYWKSSVRAPDFLLHNGGVPTFGMTGSNGALTFHNYADSNYQVFDATQFTVRTYRTSATDAIVWNNGANEINFQLQNNVLQVQKSSGINRFDMGDTWLKSLVFSVHGVHSDSSTPGVYPMFNAAGNNWGNLLVQGGGSSSGLTIEFRTWSGLTGYLNIDGTGNGDFSGTCSARVVTGKQGVYSGGAVLGTDGNIVGSIWANGSLKGELLSKATWDSLSAKANYSDCVTGLRRGPQQFASGVPSGAGATNRECINGYITGFSNASTTNINTAGWYYRIPMYVKNNEWVEFINA